MTENIKSHLKSFLLSLITDLAYDGVVGAAFTHIISQGDLSKTALYALGYAVFRTFIRVLTRELKINPNETKNSSRN